RSAAWSLLRSARGSRGASNPGTSAEEAYQDRTSVEQAGPANCLSSIILSPLDGNVKMSPHEPGDIHVDPEGIETSDLISQCVQGNLACARAAELLELSPRQVKRLKARYRQGSAAALAHASRGRPSPRRLPQRTRDRILQLARSRYAGFNDHHLHEKL